MAATDASTLIENIDFYLNNPSALQQTILGFTKTATDGQYEYVDPTNPVVNVIEAAVLTSAATVDSYNSVLRKQYAVLAQNWDELFRHMSDEDYLNRFSVPATTQFSIMFRRDEIVSKMVLDPTTGYRKVVIPRNSYFTVGGVTFSLEYPIEVRQLTHGGLQVLYDTSIMSPIQELTTNFIDWNLRQDSTGIVYLNFDFEVTQFSVKSKVYDLNSTTHFSTDISIKDNFYFARIYVRTNQNTWQEIYTTHSDVVYDAKVLTAVLQVTDSNLNVSIPEIYTADTTNNRKIRIDTYETMGELTMMLDSYPNSGFSAKWISFDDAEMDQFVAPLSTLDTIIVYSTKTVAGGKRALTFDELKERVITNAIGSPYVPISNVQIKNALEDQNYEIIKNIDVVTNRVFLASRNLPQPTNSKLITAANASIQTGLFTMASAAGVSSVIDNGTSMTICSGTIFENTNGKVTLLSDDKLNALLALPIDKRALTINDANYYYTPFHYVLDASGDTFDARVYYLDNPQVESKVFIAQNDTTKLQVTIQSYKIEKIATGYKVSIALRSSDEFKALTDGEVFVQMRFKATGENDYAYMNGTLAGQTDTLERIYTFNIDTTLNVDVNQSLILNNFLMYTTDPKKLGSSLFEEFDVIFATSHGMDVTFTPNEVDDALGRFILPPDIVGISIETLRIRFGYYLDKLWARARTVVSDANFKRYLVDEIATYKTDVYQADPVTGSTIQIVDGQVVRTKLHSAGDPIIIDGETQYTHRKGDTVLDANGDPVIVNSRELYREIDYMLIEGSYWFATDSVASDYRLEMTSIFVDWITNGLTAINDKLLEQTKIYFYPKTTTGNIDVMVMDGITTTIAASQKFLLTVFVNAQVYTNTILKNQLRVKAIQVINDQLLNPVFAISQTTNKLSDAFGSDAIDIKLEGLGGIADYQALTILNETDRPSIRKVLKAQSDGSLIVEEAVELLFIKHVLEN